MLCMDNEVGRELKASELRENTVVTIRAEGTPVLMSMWVIDIQPRRISFHAGEVKVTLMCERCGDDLYTLMPSLPEPRVRLRVYEYLGSI